MGKGHDNNKKKEVDHLVKKVDHEIRKLQHEERKMQRLIKKSRHERKKLACNKCDKCDKSSDDKHHKCHDVESDSCCNLLCSNNSDSDSCSSSSDECTTTHPTTHPCTTHPCTTHPCTTDCDFSRINPHTIRPHLHLAPTDISADAAKITPFATPSGLGPVQVKKAYGISNTYTGKGQIIAIVDAYGYPNALADFQKYCTQFSLPQPNQVTTTAALANTPPTGKFQFMIKPMATGISNNKGWSLEQALDIQIAHAVAPGASILLVQAKTANDNDMYAAVDFAVSAGASVISMSWGSQEYYGENSNDTHFTNKGNVVFCASSGDSSTTSYPSTSPYILCVGGTKVTVDGSGNRTAETVWNSSVGCEGYGLSSVYSIPTVQSANIPNLSSLTSYRTVPDIVSLADPASGVPIYNSYYSTGSTWINGVGGTSLASPLISAIIALSNQARKANSKNNLNNAQLATGLYTLFSTNSSSYANTIYNVSLNNFDIMSGVGSIRGDGFIAYLASL